MFKKRTAKNVVVGLDLDPSHIAAAEVAVNGHIAVTRGATAPLRPGILRDGEVADAEALTDALKGFFEEHQLPTRVRLGIANQRIVVRTIDLPPLPDEKALSAAVRVQAPDHIPMPMEEAVLDFQSLGLVDTPAGPRSRVVIVAVRREMVERLAHAAREAGLRVEGIDLSAFAMVRALDAPPAAGGRLYVHLAGLTNVAVANESGVLFTRAAAGGLDALVHRLSERRGLTLEHARQWMGHVGLATPLEDVEGEPDVVAATRGVLDEGVHEIADTVRNSLNFYRMQEGAENVEDAVLCGPSLAIPGFAERLGELLHLPVQRSAVDAPDEREAAVLTVAAGLAVEERA